MKTLTDVSSIMENFVKAKGDCPYSFEGCEQLLKHYKDKGTPIGTDMCKIYMYWIEYGIGCEFTLDSLISDTEEHFGWHDLSVDEIVENLSSQQNEKLYCYKLKNGNILVGEE